MKEVFCLCKFLTDWPGACILLFLLSAGAVPLLPGGWRWWQSASCSNPVSSFGTPVHALDEVLYCSSTVASTKYSKHEDCVGVFEILSSCNVPVLSLAAPCSWGTVKHVFHGCSSLGDIRNGALKCNVDGLSTQVKLCKKLIPDV